MHEAYNKFSTWLNTLSQACKNNGLSFQLMTMFIPCPLGEIQLVLKDCRRRHVFSSVLEGKNIQHKPLVIVKAGKVPWSVSLREDQDPQMEVEGEAGECLGGRVSAAPTPQCCLLEISVRAELEEWNVAVSSTS